MLKVTLALKSTRPAAEGGVAPNVDQVGLANGAVFTRIDNAVLSNSGHLSFYAKVDGKTSLWISDGEPPTRLPLRR